MTFINDRFMINNEVGATLYRDIARDLPIIDYHCHLEAKEIYKNNKFMDITQLWLAGDHYKWRAMRANGVPEAKITGNATAEEKFQAWAETVEACFGNPLYHWTHLELVKYFSIHDTLNGRNWRSIMDSCNALLQGDDFRPQALISRSNVDVICTTDAPLDDLKYHKLLRDEAPLATRVLPTFRPDDVFEEHPRRFTAFIERLSDLTLGKITTLADFLQALEQRVAYFHEVGCRISDHGLQQIDFRALSLAQVDSLFHQKQTGAALTEREQQDWNGVMMVALAKIYKKFGWTMQIHFGAIRNNNSLQLHSVGINSGFDAITDQGGLADNLNRMLDAMARQQGLPKVIIYNLNAGYNDVIAATVANFQSGEEGVKSPIQFGAGWWFNDTKRGMLNQLTTLADQGLLMNFVGMLTDSRSFVSYPRHDYFRRILCDLIGGWVAAGEVPNDSEILHRMVKNICADNARRYFQF